MNIRSLVRSPAQRLVLVGVVTTLAAGTAVATAAPRSFQAKPATVKAAKKKTTATKAPTKKTVVKKPAAKTSEQPASKRTGKLEYSTTSNRHGLAALAGKSLSGPVFISYVPVGKATSVSLQLDGRPVRKDIVAPYDLMGGSTSTALPLNPSESLASHTVKVTVAWDGGGTTTTSATFRLSPKVIAAVTVIQQQAAAPAVPAAAAPVTQLPAPPSTPVLADGDLIPAGMPGPTSTGTLGYLTLTGSLTITAPGTYQDLDVHGHIDVMSPGVVLDNVKVDAADADYAISNQSGSLLTISDCDLGPSGTDRLVATAVKYSDYTLTRCNVHGTTDGLIANGDVDVEDSWIHGLYSPTGSPTSDGVVVQSGSHVTVNHTTISSRPHDADGNLVQGASVVSVISSAGAVSDVQVTGSALLGDPLYLVSVLASGSNAAPSDVSINSNVLGPKETAPGTSDGYITAVLQGSAGGTILSGNTSL